MMTGDFMPVAALGLGVLSGLIITTLYLGGDYLWNRWKKHKGSKDNEALIDYMTACHELNAYIDPERNMNERARISLQHTMLDKFSQYPGAVKGDLFNRRLLHLWIQVNAGKLLVKYQGEVH